MLPMWVLSALTGFAAVAYFFYLAAQGLLALLRSAKQHLLPFSKEHRTLLEQHSAFYLALGPRDRHLFERQVEELMYEKEWAGMGIVVTEEMRVRISAAMAQVVFGFDDLLLQHFNRIAIYPDAYRDRHSGRMQIGGTTPGFGLLVFSWKHFVEGFNDPVNALNVGLHETAHALWFENIIPNGEYDFLDPVVLRQWRALAKEEADLINHGRGRLFRDYAATNQAEFFAVAVEYFFEQPLEFRERMPDLYTCMVKLLRQDTLANVPIAHRS